MTTKADPYSRDDELEMEAYQWNRADEIKEVLHTLVSHHPPSHYSHCLRVSILGRSIYFCSRCSGIYGGMGLGLLVFTLLGVNLQPKWLWFMLALILGFSTVTDWMTQRIAPRKTKNSIRFITGLMAGFGLAIVFLLADLLYMLLTLGIMVASVGIVGIFENRLRQVSHLDEKLVDLQDDEEDE